MNHLSHLVLCAVLFGASASFAQNADLTEGRKLYEKECLTCHGENGAETTGQRAMLLHVARAASVTANVSDAGEAGFGGAHIAVAPPFGPNLRGIIGRPAGSVEGFHYSEPFLKNLKGMVWDEGSLDVWLTSTQKWVKGVTMYYSQKDAEIRRKIIQYLKAN